MEIINGFFLDDYPNFINENNFHDFEYYITNTIP